MGKILKENNIPAKVIIGINSNIKLVIKTCEFCIYVPPDCLCGCPYIGVKVYRRCTGWGDRNPVVPSQLLVGGRGGVIVYRQCTGRKCTQYGVLSQSIVLICEGRKSACCVCLFIFSVVCLIVIAKLIIIMYVSVSVFIQCLLLLGQILTYFPYTEALDFCVLFTAMYFLFTEITIFCVLLSCSTFSRTSINCDFPANEPIFTPSTFGSPITV